jgi:hypothetical protein
VLARRQSGGPRQAQYLLTSQTSIQLGIGHDIF